MTWIDQQGDSLLTAPEVAQYLGQSVYSTRQHMRFGRIPGAVKLPGGEWRLSRADLDAYVESLKTPTAA